MNKKTNFKKFIPVVISMSKGIIKRVLTIRGFEFFLL